MAQFRIWLVLTLVALIASTLQAVEKSALVSFADLPPGDSFEIIYEESGCWAYNATEFIYLPEGSGRFEVTELLPERYDGKRWHYRRTKLGQIQLELGEKLKLDALLHHYRNPPPANADTLILIGPAVPLLHIKQRRGSQIIAEERVGDPRGEPGQPVLTFGEMRSTLLRALQTH